MRVKIAINMAVIVWGMVLTLSPSIESKVFERCELARLLKYKYGTSMDLLPIWLFIVDNESSYNTKAYNAITHDYGLFQINARYWCDENPGENKPCGKCTDLMSNDISASVKCSRIVYDAFKKAKRDPFSAWVAYNTKFKKEKNVKRYIEGCFPKSSSFQFLIDNQFSGKEPNVIQY